MAAFVEIRIVGDTSQETRWAAERLAQAIEAQAAFASDLSIPDLLHGAADALYAQSAKKGRAWLEGLGAR